MLPLATTVPEFDRSLRRHDTTAAAVSVEPTTVVIDPAAYEPDHGLLRDMDLLADRIVETLNDDQSLRPYAFAVAQYLLFVRRLPVARVVARLTDPVTRDSSLAALRKLLACRSDLLDSVPRPIGIEIIARMSADKIQRSLNVKHLQTKKESRGGAAGSSASDGIVPNIKPVILHSHPEYVWIRFRVPPSVERTMNARNDLPPGSHLVTVAARVYELYLRKQPRTLLADVSGVAAWLEDRLAADLVFCSELALFLYNKPVFVSNYLKFMWCYACDRPSFDPRTQEELQTLSVYLLYATLFLRTNNLTSMPEETHNPLISYTGERPKIAMSKFDLSNVYNAEGTRAMQTVNLGSDFGANSNYVEVASVVQLRNERIDAIV